MSDAADKKIAQLEKDVKVAQQSLFLVLKQIGEPVVIDLDEARALINSDEDKAVGIDFDTDANVCIFTAGGLGNVSG